MFVYIEIGDKLNTDVMKYLLAKHNGETSTFVVKKYLHFAYNIYVPKYV